MKTKNGKKEIYIYNDFIKNNNNINEEDFTYNYLINKSHILLLNKKINKNKDSNNLISKINSNKINQNLLLKSNPNNINEEEWHKNKIKITQNIKEKKIIFSLESEKETDNIKTILIAFKDKKIYLIYKYKSEEIINNMEIKAKMKWNIFSNHFKIYDKCNNTIEEINYKFNFKGWNGPTKLQILLPCLNKNIINGSETERNNNNLFFQKMENKTPEYSNIFKCYILNFINRKIIPNEKNIQIIYSDDKGDKNNILLQFAKVGNNEYILDYKYPFNSITAFGLALSNLSSRIFYQ